MGRLALLIISLVASATGLAAQRSAVIKRRSLLAGAASVGAAIGMPPSAKALVKGSAPPAKMSPPKERKCKSIDECEALGDAERAKMSAGADETIERTTGGDRYRDLRVGSGKAAASGDLVDIQYRVMRLGTKSRDGLSGEGQTIFSYGFGEDDDKEGVAASVQLGSNLVDGVNAALIGMQPGGKRRVLVRPERGWKEQTGACANIVFAADIGAAVENENACLTKTKQPLPRSYGARQRFARRFDESLLVELDMVGFSDKKSLQQSAQYVYDKCEQNPFAEGCDPR
jgi:FKBP-type peptidyl-prolyl cis-trans isomerase